MLKIKLLNYAKRSSQRKKGRKLFELDIFTAVFRKAANFTINEKSKADFYATP